MKYPMGIVGATVIGGKVILCFACREQELISFDPCLKAHWQIYLFISVEWRKVLRIARAPLYTKEQKHQKGKWAGPVILWVSGGRGCILSCGLATELCASSVRGKQTWRDRADLVLVEPRVGGEEQESLHSGREWHVWHNQEMHIKKSQTSDLCCSGTPRFSVLESICVLYDKIWVACLFAHSFLKCPE